ncbi:YcaO-like family protein [Desulfococcaceae bacterium HSG9]|nr:YcaO-like family protein [Desulfococcaceae bacterium HSG9]
MNNPIVLKDAYKQFTIDQDKIISPQETLKRFKDRLNQVKLDILEKTERIDNGRLDIPVYFSRCGRDARVLTGTSKQMGKGGSPDQAEASAVMELAERFSLFSFINTPSNFINAKMKDLDEEAISFEMIAKSVHDESADVEPMQTIFADLPLQWTPVYNLTRQQKILAPFNWFFTINEFNGSSAGNCVEEGLLQGICELVERDVSARVSQKELSVPAIGTAEVSDPMVLELLAKYQKAGIKLFLNDFTLDTGIPTVSVMAYDSSTFPNASEIVWTAGTTPDPEKALSRALTETAQLGGDFNTAANYVASGLPKLQSPDQAAFITQPDREIAITDLPNLSDNNIKTEIENVLAALERKHKEVFVVDTMHSQLKIPAFYTFIPGAYFRERAQSGGVGMFVSKIITQTLAPQKAISELKVIQKKLSQRYYLDFYMGTCFLELDDPSVALTHFTSALNLNPANTDIASIYSYMGVCLKETGNYDKAVEMLNEGVKFDNERTDIYNLLGFCHFKLKKHEEAIDYFHKVLRLNPSSGIDYANIAVNYDAIGEKTKAVEYYAKALLIDPKIDFARENLAKLQA